MAHKSQIGPILIFDILQIRINGLSWPNFWASPVTFTLLAVASSRLCFNSGGDRASTRTDSVSICEGALPLPSTKGARNPGYCGDLDGRGASFEAASCLFPSTGVLKPDVAGLPCAGAACGPADCCVANVFVNELLPTPASAESPEWVEIFNAGATEGSLAGWTLEDGAPERRTAHYAQLALPSTERLPYRLRSAESCGRRRWLRALDGGGGQHDWRGRAFRCGAGAGRGRAG